MRAIEGNNDSLCRGAWRADQREESRRYPRGYIARAMKTESSRDANFVVTGGTASSRQVSVLCQPSRHWVITTIYGAVSWDQFGIRFNIRFRVDIKNKDQITIREDKINFTMYEFDIKRSVDMFMYSCGSLL